MDWFAGVGLAFGKAEENKKCSKGCRVQTQQPFAINKYRLI